MDYESLEGAIVGRADAIVSADDNLLTLKPLEGIPTHSPAILQRMRLSHRCEQGLPFVSDVRSVRISECN